MALTGTRLRPDGGRRPRTGPRARRLRRRRWTTRWAPGWIRRQLWWRRRRPPRRDFYGGGEDDKGKDGKQLFSDQAALHEKWDPKSPEAWLQTTINYWISRAASMEELLEWTERQQKKVIDKSELAALSGTDACPMHDAGALSRNLWGYLNLALGGSAHAATFNTVQKTNGLEARRKLVFPLRQVGGEEERPPHPGPRTAQERGPLGADGRDQGLGEGGRAVRTLRRHGH